MQRNKTDKGNELLVARISHQFTLLSQQNFDMENQENLEFIQNILVTVFREAYRIFWKLDTAEEANNSCNEHLTNPHTTRVPRRV